jgi:alanyl-tRNA synthetase
MDSRTIRDRFLEFFGERAHERVPSSSLISNDPSLLLTNAGMNQFIPYFKGEQTPPFARAMSLQKCFRTVDIDEVGKTARHLTFFEMLGNFSFGDYYKSEVCKWAWALVTEGYGLDPDRLWPTVFETDDEAMEIWLDEVGVRRDRIVRRGAKDNFWSTGAAGPCGPCSEIFFDLGEAYGPASDQGPAGNEDRYLEIWNLVFMQNECNAQIEPIADLPKKNIDTGLGVERLALVLQNAASIYETDTLGGLVQRAGDLTESTYGSDERVDKALRILADHGRALTFLIADGVLPSNEERGYVLRRVMRRAVREARRLGRDAPILPPLIETTIELMGDAYPEVNDRRDFIIQIAAREEERFDATLKQGMSLLQTEVDRARDEGAENLPSNVAFQLHDTFGFPIDITTDVAQEAGLDIAPGFDDLMAGQRARARAARKSAGPGHAAEALRPLLSEQGETDFLGYEHLQTTGKVTAIYDGSSALPVASEGDELYLVSDRTSFYAEGGGQVGDRGGIVAGGGRAEVLDTQRLLPGLTGHRVRVVGGEIHVGDEIETSVDPVLRLGAEQAHTATHVLHWILRDRLGEHARQAGSLVEPGRLRFDFSHFEALGRDRVADIATELQQRVSLDDPVRAYETSYDFARSLGAMAIFGEKYGDFVRVVEVGEYSKELCGGTHLAHTSRIGVVVVTGEGSVGANIRRIEALVGDEGLAFLGRRIAVLERAAETLKTNPDEVAARVEQLMSTHKEMERRLHEIDRSSADAEAAELASSAADHGGVRLVVARRDVGVDVLRALAQTVKGKLGSAVVVLGTVGDSNANLVAGVTKDLTAKGLSARDLLAAGASLLGGGAGGKPELAISGGPNKERLDEALQAVAAAVRDAVGKAT